MKLVPQLGQRYVSYDAAYSHIATVLDVFAQAPHGVFIVYSRSDMGPTSSPDYPFVAFLDTFLIAYTPYQEPATCVPSPNGKSSSKISSQWALSWFTALRERWNHAILFFKQPW